MSIKIVRWFTPRYLTNRVICIGSRSGNRLRGYLAKYAFKRIKISALLEIQDAIPGFKSVFVEEEGMLPYSINLLDELHANENAHSRILSKLLQFPEKIQDHTLYPILDLFLKKLEEPFSQLVQHRP